MTLYTAGKTLVATFNNKKPVVPSILFTDSFNTKMIGEFVYGFLQENF